MGRVTGIQWYYQAAMLLFLFLAVFSLIFSSRFGEDKCYTTEPEETDATIEETTSLVEVPKYMGIFYLVECILSFFMVVLLYYFSNLDIAKFAKLNFCQRLMGRLSKLLPYLVNLAHLVLFILIAVQVLYVFAIKDCEDAEHFNEKEGTTEKGVMQEQGEWHIIVCSAIWLAMHVCGGFLRRNVYYDPFFYQPENKEDKCKNWVFVRCGP